MELLRKTFLPLILLNRFRICAKIFHQKEPPDLFWNKLVMTPDTSSYKTTVLTVVSNSSTTQLTVSLFVEYLDSVYLRGIRLEKSSVEWLHSWAVFRSLKSGRRVAEGDWHPQTNEATQNRSRGSLPPLSPRPDPNPRSPWHACHIWTLIGQEMYKSGTFKDQFSSFLKENWY